MALQKTGYADANQGQTNVKIAIDENGYIATETAVAVSAKNFNIKQVNSENGLEDNTEVLNFFLQLAGGRADSLTNTMSVKWEV